jgi:aspartyl-tRNA(Asn)/glutamyl-tRNA(Gln) amidotransferase subunit A
VDCTELTIHEAALLISQGKLSPVELVKSILEKIDRLNSAINAYVTVVPDMAVLMAQETEKLIRKEMRKAISGIPLAIKDNICTRGVRTTCSSKILENFIPPYESTVTERLLQSGYVLPGKTNLDEFAMGSSTENSAFGVTKNPWDITTIPGGSSGGSAAAVASHMCIGALGSDTGGSIRQPASFCGVVGLKPTYGRVSRFGLVAFASSLDQIGPLTKDVHDSAFLLNIIAGHDPRDSTSAPVEVPDFTKVLGKEIKGMKIGIPREYFAQGIDKEVEDSVKSAIQVLESQGAMPVDISLPHTNYGIATYYILATSEASSNLARYDGVKYGVRVDEKNLSEMYFHTRGSKFGQEVKRRIMLGTYALSSGYYDAYYKKAQQVRTLFMKDFQKAFTEVDIIVTPTSPTAAFKTGEKISDPLTMYMSDIYTLSVNLAGLPAISVPCGFTTTNLPVGLQLIGRHFDEETIFKTAYVFEQATDWHKRRVKIK